MLASFQTAIQVMSEGDDEGDPVSEDANEGAGDAVSEDAKEIPLAGDPSALGGTRTPPSRRWKGRTRRKTNACKP